MFRIVHKIKDKMKRSRPMDKDVMLDGETPRKRHHRHPTFVIRKYDLDDELGKLDQAIMTLKSLASEYDDKSASTHHFEKVYRCLSLFKISNNKHFKSQFDLISASIRCSIEIVRTALFFSSPPKFKYVLNNIDHRSNVLNSHWVREKLVFEAFMASRFDFLISLKEIHKFNGIGPRFLLPTRSRGLRSTSEMIMTNTRTHQPCYPSCYCYPTIEQMMKLINLYGFHTIFKFACLTFPSHIIIQYITCDEMSFHDEKNLSSLFNCRHNHSTPDHDNLLLLDRLVISELTNLELQIPYHIQTIITSYLPGLCTDGCCIHSFLKTMT